MRNNRRYATYRVYYGRSTRPGWEIAWETEYQEDLCYICGDLMLHVLASEPCATMLQIIIYDWIHPQQEFMWSELEKDIEVMITNTEVAMDAVQAWKQRWPASPAGKLALPASHPCNPDKRKR